MRWPNWRACSIRSRACWARTCRSTTSFYDQAPAQAQLNPDGSVTLRLPSTIGEIRFANIRVGSASGGPSFGRIDIHNIDLRGTTITLTPR